MNRKKDKAKHGSAAPLPCTRVEDFYAAPARHTIGRLIGDWLHRHKLTVTEFLHCAAALQKFEAAGTTYQHAIQRIAVTLAGKTGASVVEIIKGLNALSTSAIQRFYGDERQGLFQELDAEGLAELAVTLEAEPRGAYILTGALAKYLAAFATWDDKLSHVIRLHTHAEKTEGAELLCRVTEALTAEIVGDPHVLSELLGADKEFGDRLFTSIRLFKGERVEVDGVALGLRLLARHFAKNDFADARAALANHILSECRGTKRLRPLSLEGELMAFRVLVDELKPVEGPYFQAHELAAAFSERSKRFIMQEALVQLLGAARTPDEKLDRLLMLESKLEGAANKRALTPFAASILSTRAFEEEIGPEYAGIMRLARLADLQRRIIASGLQEAERDKMAGALDAAAGRLEAQGRYFAGIDARLTDPAERATAYLRLFAAGAFTEGRLATKARRALLAVLATPDFASSYTKDKAGDRQVALMALVEELRKIGISPEESIRAMTPT